MTLYAKLESNLVVNVVVAESDWIGLSIGDWIAYDNDVNPAMIGSTYNPASNMFEIFDEESQAWIVLSPQEG
jgi:hypothetical protein